MRPGKVLWGCHLLHNYRHCGLGQSLEQHVPVASEHLAKGRQSPMHPHPRGLAAGPCLPTS